MKEHLEKSGCSHRSVQGVCTCVGEMCWLCTSTPVSLMLFVLLWCAVNGVTHGLRRDRGFSFRRRRIEMVHKPEGGN